MQWQGPGVSLGLEQSCPEPGLFRQPAASSAPRPPPRLAPSSKGRRDQGLVELITLSCSDYRVSRAGGSQGWARAAADKDQGRFFISTPTASSLGVAHLEVSLFLG